MHTVQPGISKPDSLPGEDRADRIPAALAALSTLLATLTVAITLRILYICYSPVPWGDTWDYWSWAQKYSQHPFWHLAAQHTEHRIAVGRLFFLFDQFFVSGTAKSLATFIPLIQLAHAAVLTYLILKVPGLRTSTRWFLASATLAALFSLQQFANFTWYFQISFVAVYFGATISCVLMLEFVRQERSSRKNSGLSLLWMLLTMLAALATTYSLASGLLIWPVLLSFALFGNLARSKQLVLICAWAITWYAYLHGYAARPEASTPLEALSHTAGFFRFLLVVLGNPLSDVFSEFDRRITKDTLFTLAEIVGLFGLLGTGVVVALWRATARRDAPRSRDCSLIETTIAHIFLFVLLSAALIAVGRFKFPLSEALSSRYTTPSLLFWLLLLVLLIIRCERSARRRVWLGCDYLKGFILVVQVAFLFCNKPARTSYAESYAGYLRESQTAVANNVFDIDRWSRLYYDPKALLSLSDYLRGHNLSVFHEPWLKWSGERIAEHYQVIDLGCRGAIDTVVPVISAPPGYRLDGWAWSAVSEPASMVIILTDPNGKIIGSALGGVSRPDVALSLKRPSATHLGWTGYVAGLEAQKAVAYLVVRRGKQVCMVASKDLGSR